MTNKLELSVILPTYNEEKTIESIVEKIMSLFNDTAVEIIIVNDGSTDTTGEIANRLTERYPATVEAIHFQTNRGKTNALRTGISNSRGDFIATIDSDLQYEPSDILRLLNVIKNGNFVLVSGRRNDRQDNMSRRFFSYFFNLYNRILFDIRLNDINCGLKVYKRELFDKIKLEYEGWFVDVEMLAKITKYKLPVYEMPIEHHARKTGKSKISLSRMILENLIYGTILKLKLLTE